MASGGGPNCPGCESLRVELEHLREVIDLRENARLQVQNVWVTEFERRMTEMHRRFDQQEAEHAEIISGRRPLVEKLDHHIDEWLQWRTQVEAFMNRTGGEGMGAQEQATRIRNTTFVGIGVATLILALIELVLAHV